MYRIIGADHREYGPVSAEQIRQWIKEGRVNGATLMQAEGAPGWRPMATFSEFGTPPQTPPPTPAATPSYVPAPSQTNGNAITGLIFGILSITCVCGALPIGAIGIIFSCIALSQLNSNPGQKGKGMAIAGLVLSIIGILMFFGYGALSLLPHHGGRYYRQWSF